MAERSSTQQERGNLRRQLTPERKAELDKLSKNHKEEQTDSGFVDEMDEESCLSTGEEDSLDKQAKEDESAIIYDLEEETSRLTLETRGSNTTAAVTEVSEEQRSQYAQAIRYQENVLKSVKNRECNVNGDTLLHVAIIHRREMPFGLAEFAIQCAPDSAYLDTYNGICQTPLHLAVITRESKIVRTLIENGARIDIPDRNGNLPLHIACRNGDVACITEITRPMHDKPFARSFPNTRNALIKSLEATNYDGFTALHIAAFNRQKCIVQYLVQNCGADVDTGDSKSGRTALHHAVEAHNLDMVMHLIGKCYADVNVQTRDECTPLHIATGRRLDGIKNFLLAAGADLTIQNSEGDCPSI